MDEPKLTPKQAKFVDEYLVDFNASAAARRAKYSKKTAYDSGWSNLRKPDVQRALQLRAQELSNDPHG